MTFDRALLEQPATIVAPLLLGGVLRVDDGVALRITEVEAYLGVGEDPGSHAHHGMTPRTTVMFGEPGHLYAYFTYGMHTCVNVVTSPSGQASAVLLRAGQIVDGIDLARIRRLTARSDVELARGPARLAVALGLTLADNGADLAAGRLDLTLPAAPVASVTSLRTGVAGAGGLEPYSWRFAIPDDPTVSPYRRSPRLPLVE